MNSSEHHSHEKGVQRRRQNNAESNREHVRAEEVEIHVKEGQDSHQKQSPPPHYRFQLRTGGCLGTLVGFIVLSFLLVIFLPIGIIAILGLAGYLGWKYRHFLRRHR